MSQTEEPRTPHTSDEEGAPVADAPVAHDDAHVARDGATVPTSDGPGGEDVPPTDDDAPAAIDPATIRRAPRYGRFAFTGVVLSALLAFVLAALPIGQSELDTGTVVGLLLITFVPVGVIVGLVIALVLDRRSARAADRRSRHTPGT